MNGLQPPPPARVTAAQMESWVRDFDSWDVCDQVCSSLFDRTPFAYPKAFEWSAKFHHGLYPSSAHLATLPPGEQVFFGLYFTMTGLHALHMIIGIGMMLVITWMSWKGKFDEHYYTPVEMAGLYWHFVDIVWIFLFPLLYLIERHT